MHFIYFFLVSNGEIDCFECTVYPPEQYLNKTTRLCSKFDGSDHFQVHCPDSTYCMKKSFWIELPDGGKSTNNYYPLEHVTTKQAVNDLNKTSFLFLIPNLCVLF